MELNELKLILRERKTIYKEQKELEKLGEEESNRFSKQMEVYRSNTERNKGEVGTKHKRGSGRTSINYTTTKGSGNIKDIKGARTRNNNDYYETIIERSRG